MGAEKTVGVPDTVQEEKQYQSACCCDDDHEWKNIVTECVLLKCQGMREEHLSFAETGACDQERGSGPTHPGYRGPHCNKLIA